MTIYTSYINKHKYLESVHKPTNVKHKYLVQISCINKHKYLESVLKPTNVQHNFIQNQFRYTAVDY